MAPRAERTVRRETEDSVVFLVLVFTLFFIVFMLSVPLWLSALIRGLAG